MNNVSPKQTAILTALVSACIVLIGIFLTTYTRRENVILISLIFSFASFFFVYFLSLYFLNNFIIKKINPIYKTIQDVSINQKDFSDEFEDSDIIQGVKKDVMHWAKKKTLEIAQLKQLEKYRRDFLGNVSHELKTPIFNIQGYISTLLDGGLEDPSVNRNYLLHTEKSINRLISIVNDLESISRLESGELKLDIQKFNILKLFEDSFYMHEIMANEREIKLKFAHRFDTIWVSGDRKRILEAVNNLIINSIKYGKKGGHTIIDFHDMDGHVLIEVTDNGLGIEEKDIPRIFERFFRTDKSRSREIGGTGLGLSIVKHIIEAHGQTINVKSKKGEGSTFYFTLIKG